MNSFKHINLNTVSTIVSCKALAGVVRNNVLLPLTRCLSKSPGLIKAWYEIPGHLSTLPGLMRDWKCMQKNLCTTRVDLDACAGTSSQPTLCVSLCECVYYVCTFVCLSFWLSGPGLMGLQSLHCWQKINDPLGRPNTATSVHRERKREREKLADSWLAVNTVDSCLWLMTELSHISFHWILISFVSSNLPGFSGSHTTLWTQKALT